MKITPLYEVCNSCNYDRHWCHFCGAPLTHDQAVRGRDSVDPHPCYVDNV